MNQAKVKYMATAVLGMFSPESQEIVKLFHADVKPSEIAQRLHLPLEHVRNVCADFYTLMLARTV